MSDLDDEIATNAAGPKRVSTDAGSAEAHSIPDQIAADRHIAGKTAAKNTRRGLLFTRLRPPGTP